MYGEFHQARLEKEELARRERRKEREYPVRAFIGKKAHFLEVKIQDEKGNEWLTTPLFHAPSRYKIETENYRYRKNFISLGRVHEARQRVVENIRKGFDQGKGSSKKEYWFWWSRGP